MMKNRKQKVGIFIFLLFGMVIFSFGTSTGAKENIKLNQKSITIIAGKSRNLKLNGISNKKKKGVSWKSSDNKVVAVNKTGKITAKKKGYVTVTASFKGKKYKCKVSVLSKENANYNKKAVTSGTKYYKDFLVDNVFHSKNDGDIHYNVYIPDSYNGKSQYALFVTLPGYQGLYFQGVAENIKTENFGFEARKYNSKMIVLAPQLNDWGETSANQTIALVEYFLSYYKINPSKVYINGYSGGGETLSLVLGKRPELFTAALMCSSQWDGEYKPLIKAKTPVYFVIGEKDEYYGARPFREAYQTLHDLYKKQGLSEKEIKKLLVLDIKTSAYFENQGVTNQHGYGGVLFSKEEKIMKWLFRK